MTDQPETETVKVPSLRERIEKSSQVCYFGYDSEKQELQVIFKTNPTLYAYKNFPSAEFERVLNEEPSLGSYLIRCVTRRPKGGGDLPYEFEKRELTPEQVEIWKNNGNAESFKPKA